VRARRGRRGGHGWVLPAAAPRLGCAPQLRSSCAARSSRAGRFPALASPHNHATTTFSAWSCAYTC